MARIPHHQRGDTPVSGGQRASRWEKRPIWVPVSGGQFIGEITELGSIAANLSVLGTRRMQGFTMDTDTLRPGQSWGYARLHCMTHLKNISRLLLEVIVLLGVIEVLIMLALPYLLPGLSGIVEAVLDAALLAVLATPAVVWRVARAFQQADATVPHVATSLRLQLLAALLVLMGGLTVTGIAMSGAHAEMLDKARISFSGMKSMVADEASWRLTQQSFGLEGARGVFAAGESINRHEFRAYVQSHNIGQDSSGVAGIGFIERVPRPQLDAFTARERADGAPGFSVQSTGTAADLMVVKFLEPQLDAQFIGTDLAADPMLQASIGEAIASGEAAASHQMQLPGAAPGTRGFVVMLPVYRGGAIPTTVQDRTEQFSGLVFAVVNAAKCLSPMSRAGAGGLNFCIHASSHADDESLLFSSEAAHDDCDAHDQLFNATEQFSVYGEPWTLVASSTPQFDLAIDRSIPATIATCGMILSMLLAASLLSLLMSRDRARVLAHEMTRELRASEEAARMATLKAERVAEIARRTSNAIMIMDELGLIEWVNDGFTRITGYTAAEVTGRRPSDFLHGPATETAAAEALSALILDRRSGNLEITSYTKEGRPIVLRVEIAPLSTRAGAQTGSMIISSDITEQKRATEALAIERERLDLAVSGADLGLWDWNPVTGTLVVNDRWAAMLGYTLDELPATVTAWSSRVHPDDLQMVTRTVRQAMEQNTAYSCEHRLRHRDGSWRWILDQGRVAARNAQGQVVRMVGTHTDITARKDSERRMVESERRFRMLADSAPMLVWTSGTDAKCDYFNRSWLDFTGRSTAMELGDGWTQGVHPDDLSHCMQTYQEAFTARQPFEMEYRLRRHDGVYRTLLDRGTPRLSIDGVFDGFVGACVDVTELHEAQHRAEAANKAKSEFLANMSHEIRTPLTAILGFADLLRDDGDIELAPQRRVHAIDTIKNAGTHLLTIINDILDLSKIEADQMTTERIETPLGTILRDLETLMRQRARDKSIALETLLETPIPDRIVSDPTRLRQILMNLIGNAVKFTQAGKVTVRVAAINESSSQRLRIDVEDTGPGMTADQADRLFHAFVQADGTVTRRFGGTGLGLMISRRLASLMGGTVSLAHTLLGQGSTFRVELPLEAVTDAVPLSSLSPGAAPSPSPTPEVSLRLDARILVAEDGIDNQRLIKFHLTKAGARVDIAENGQLALEALERAHREGTPYDLLLTDMQMPVMDGYTLARTLREQGSKMPIVALTAHAMADDRAKCTNAGCDDYATKPIDRQALIQTCLRWLPSRPPAAVQPT